jgi:tryptophan 2,3-dioxygenase
MDCPAHRPASGELTYGSYLRVPELLQLQTLQVPGHSHDELLFIVIHQAYELWFKQLLFELDTVQRLLQQDQLREAHRLLQRVLAIEKLLVDQIELLSTMTPRDFCHFRQALTPASGFQSIQFRALEFLTGLKDPDYLDYTPAGSPDRLALEARLDAPSLLDTLLALLRRHGFEVPADPADLTGRDALLQAARSLVPLYRDIEAHPALYDVCEALVAHEHSLTLWRFHHARVVERIIGTKPGTGGSTGMDYLDSTLRKRAFSLLWTARGMLDEDELFATYSPP